MLDNGKNSFNPAYLYYTISKGTGILISVEEKAPKFMRILFMAFAPDL
jgi:hypothetical protein